MELLTANDLCCSYGTKSVLHDISFSISSGTITGLLGPSGAGKTTLVNLLTGQLKPDKGVITQAVSSPAAGIMMDDLGLYERLTVWDNLALFAELYRVSRKRIDPLLIRTGLIHAKKQTVSSLSKGMRNRVNFCRALLKDVQILYLDEPTSGLDPATTEKIHELILEERKKGTAVFLTTHNMYEAQKLCDNILLLNNGTIIEQGKPEDICLKYNQKNVMTLTLKDGKKQVFPNAPAYAAHVARLIQEEQITSIHSSEPTLEQVFLHLTGRSLL